MWLWTWVQDVCVWQGKGQSAARGAQRSSAKGQITITLESREEATLDSYSTLNPTTEITSQSSTEKQPWLVSSRQPSTSDATTELVLGRTLVPHSYWFNTENEGGKHHWKTTTAGWLLRRQQKSIYENQLNNQITATWRRLVRQFNLKNASYMCIQMLQIRDNATRFSSGVEVGIVWNVTILIPFLVPFRSLMMTFRILSSTWLNSKVSNSLD